MNLIVQDFEEVARNYFKDNLEKVTIFTNLPYGIRSKEHMTDKELKSVYIRFANLIKKNIDSLDEVFIFTTVSENNNYH